MTRWIILLAPVLLAAASPDYTSARRKFDLIESDRAAPGARIVLTPRELNAWVLAELPAAVPQGVRNPRLDLGSRTATGAALIDFARVRSGLGHPPGWLMGRLLEGERPVRITARIRSAAGQATVDVEQVEISGVAIDGQMLDFLIRNFLLPMYPNAAVGRPFELGHRIERLDVQPAEVTVLIGR